MRSERVLISGFEAFGGATSNPSAMICEALMDRHFDSDAHDYELATVILPVTFADAFARLESTIQSFKPTIILCLGQAGGRSSIDFERVAVNMIDADVADNSGKIYRETPITEGGATAHLSMLPLRKLCDTLGAAGHSVQISNTAGLYVCNFLFYKLMEFVQAQSLTAGFVHLPYLPEQAREAFARHEAQSRATGGTGLIQGEAQREPPPSMEFNKMLAAIQLAVEILTSPTKR